MIRHRHHTTHTRDAALRQLHRVNRWMIAGSVVLTGVLADVAANAFPGKTIKKTSSARSHSKHTSTSSSHTTTGVLKPPSEAPKASESEASRSPEAPPAEEASPQGSAPAQESAPARESAPAQESAPAPETTPPPEPESSGPVVSGGS
ncbi:MAG TPA: hypothetical protein VII01_13035 [Solirubrobacteraceae bacterium]|jgi:hypothetical protein